MKKNLVLTTLIVLGSSSVFAETYDLSRRFGIGGGAGWTIPSLGNDFDEGANDDLTWNGHLRYNFSAANAMQFNYQRMDWQKTDIAANVWDLMWINRWRPYDRFTPIFGLGAGVADMINIDPYDTLKPALRARFGFEYALTEDLFANAMVDYQYIAKVPGSERDDNSYLPTGEIHSISPQVGLTLFFGSDKQKDNQDKPKAAPAPAPVQQPVAAAAAPLAGGDGDDDGDGVINSRDKCPGTEINKQVNGYGCVAEEKASIQVRVLFTSGSAVMTNASSTEVEELAAFLKEHPKTKAEIQGHTDSTGSAAKNKKLSEQRAQAVKTALVEKHQIPADRINAVGFGPDQPIGDNNTPEGRADNRRVMAIISE